MWVRYLGWKDPLAWEITTHSSILAWREKARIPWTEKPGGLWSMGSQRVRHEWSHHGIEFSESLKKSNYLQWTWFYNLKYLAPYISGIWKPKFCINFLQRLQDPQNINPNISIHETGCQPPICILFLSPNFSTDTVLSTYLCDMVSHFITF